MKKRIKETFLQSIFFLVVSQIVVKIFGMVCKLYLTNKQEFGDIGNAIQGGSFQIYTLFLSFSIIGIPSAVSRMVAEKGTIGDNRGANRIFKISLILYTIIGLVESYVLFYFAKGISNYFLFMPETELSIQLLAPSLCFVSISSVFKGYFNGREKMRVTARSQSLGQIFKTIFTISLIEIIGIVANRNNAEIMSALTSFSITIGNFIELVIYYREYKQSLSEISTEIKQSVNEQRLSVLHIIKEIMIVAIPISISSIISTLSKNIDSFMVVGILRDIVGYEEAKKQYGILTGKVDALILLPLSFNMTIASALLPSIAAYSKNLDKIRNRINNCFILEFSVAIPITIFYCFFASNIFRFLFPNAQNGSKILVISALSIIFITCEQIFNSILNGIGKSKCNIIAVILGMIVKVIINTILIRSTNIYIGGIKGAAIATVICHFVICICLYIFVRKHINIELKLKKNIIILIISFAICGIGKILMKKIEMLFNYKISFMISSFFMFILYLIMLKTIKIYKKPDTRAIDKIHEKP